MENDTARVVLEKYLGNLSENPMFGMASGMKVDTLASIAPYIFNEKLIYILNKELTQIGKC